MHNILHSIKKKTHEFVIKSNNIWAQRFKIRSNVFGIYSDLRFHVIKFSYLANHRT